MRGNIIPIVANVEERWVQVGTTRFSEYCRFTLQGLAEVALKDNFPWKYTNKGGARNKEITKRLGITPRKYMRVYIACVNKVFLDPLRKLGLIDLCFSNGGIEPKLVLKVWHRREELLATPKNMRVFTRRWGNHWPDEITNNLHLFSGNSEGRNKLLLKNLHHVSTLNYLCNLDNTILRLCSTTSDIWCASTIRKWYPKGKKQLTKKYLTDLSGKIRRHVKMCNIMGIDDSLPDTFEESIEKMREIAIMHRAYVEITQ